MVKGLFGIALSLFIVSGVAAQSKAGDFHQWAATPPLGWNSWDCYGPTVTEAEVKANADYMATHLKKYGWEYIIVDIRWYVGNDKSHGYNETNPDYSIDAYGRFTPAVNRFPSAKDGRGFKSLADYIHSKGLKFGIHIMRGVPVIAVKRNLPVLHSKATAKDIYTDSIQCRWLRDMYTVVAGRDGAQEYYNSIVQLYADWGVDFIKCDDLSSPYHAAEIEMLRKAIDKTGRKILLSTSPGETPVEDAKHVQQHANMWRTVGDFWDSWQQLKEHFAVFERWNPYRIKGAWPDGDMLPLGHIGIRAERGNNRMTAFTKDEQFTLMTLWSIFKSPLMFGGDLPGNDDFTLKLITNKAVLNVLKYSTGNKELFNKDGMVAWVADDPATGDKYLALFNAADQEQAVESKAIWKSDVLNRQHQYTSVDINIKDAKKLYLVATDGGDNIEWDHADWINPFLHNDKDSVALTSLEWSKATAGWEKPHINKAVSGSPLIVNEQQYANGIGTHSNSVVEYDIPEGYNRFSALVGLDKAGIVQNVGATVKFMIFTENPSGPMPAATAKIPVKLSEIGINGNCVITNLWTGEKLGEFTGEFAPSINRHGAGLYRIAKKK